jgi:hypothetical protein
MSAAEQRAGINVESTGGAPFEAPGSRVRCSRCDADAPAGTTNCPACGVFLPSNEANLKHGLRRYQREGKLPAELQEYIETFRDQLVADQGGESELSAVRGGLVDKLVDLEVATRLLMAETVRRGIDSRPGKAAWQSALRTIETWHRLATTLGIERRQKRATLADWAAGK